MSIGNLELVIITCNVGLLLGWLVLTVLALLGLRGRGLSGTPLALWVLLILAVPILGPLAFWIVRPTGGTGG